MDDSTIIGFMNIESLRAHLPHLMQDEQFLKCDVIGLAETWLYTGEELPTAPFESHYINNGRGKGLATLTRHHLNLIESIKKNLYSMMKIQIENKFIIFVYISKTANPTEYINDIETLLQNTDNFPTVLIGDVNWHYKQQSHPMKKYMLDKNYEQLVQKPTHDDGNIIDHVYINQLMKDMNVQIFQKPVIYSDHYALFMKI